MEAGTKKVLCLDCRNYHLKGDIIVCDNDICFCKDCLDRQRAKHN